MSNPFEEQQPKTARPTTLHKMASMTKHNFQWHNYKRPTFCAHCTNLLVGVMKQGMRCKRCEVNVHDKCQEDLEQQCLELMVGQHNFREKTYKQPTYCDYCTKLLVGLVNQGMKCSECGTNVHEKCQDKIEAMCEQTQSRKTDFKLKREKGSRRATRSKGPRGRGAGGSDRIALKSMNSSSQEKTDSPDADSLFATMPTKGKSTLDSPVVGRKTTPVGSPIPSPKTSRSPSMAEGTTTTPTPSSSKKLSQAQVLVDDVVDIMSDNVRKMNERGEKLESLKDNAEQLEEKANLFEKKAKEIKKKMWFKNYKMWIILIIAALVVIAIIVVSVVLNKKK